MISKKNPPGAGSGASLANTLENALAQRALKWCSAFYARKMSLVIAGACVVGSGRIPLKKWSLTHVGRPLSNT